MSARNCGLVYDTGEQRPLFHEADDGRLFALNRKALVALCERQEEILRSPDYSNEWRRIVQLSFIGSVVSHARLLHAQAIDSGDLDHIRFTWRQLERVQAVYDAWAQEFRMARHDTIRKRKQGGHKSRGAKRTNGHDWDAICCNYDRLLATGMKRPRIINRLARTYDMRKDVLRRGLRQRERGSNPTHIP